MREPLAVDPLKDVKAKVRLNLIKAGSPIVRADRAVELAFSATDAAMHALALGCTYAPGPLQLIDPAETARIEALALQLALPLIQERLFKAEAALREGLAAIASNPATPDLVQ